MSDETEADYQAGLIEQGYDDAARHDQQAASLVSNERKQLSAVAKALNWQPPYQASLAKRAEALMAKCDNLQQQVEARDKMLRQKDEAMAALFELLDKARVDYSHLIS